MAEDEEDGTADQEELDALEEAVNAEDADDADAAPAEEGGEESLDPLAEEMLKMMEEEGDEGQASQEDVDRMMEVEMLKAMEAEGGGVGGGAAAGGVAALTRGAGAGGLPPSVSRLMDVSLSVTIELGRTEATLEEVMSFGEQSLVELDKQVGDPVDILVNGKLFAKGEVVTVSENFGVRITELLTAVTDL